MEDMLVGGLLVAVCCLVGLLFGVIFGRTARERQIQEDKLTILDAAREVLPKKEYIALLERYYEKTDRVLGGDT